MRQDVLAALEQRGRPSSMIWCDATGGWRAKSRTALWELVAGGLVTADGFENLRALIDPKRRRGEGRGRIARPRHAAGRWALATKRRESGSNEKWAAQLLLDGAWCFATFSHGKRCASMAGFAARPAEDGGARARSAAAGFVSGFSGEQFARPEALDLLRAASETVKRTSLRTFGPLTHSTSLASSCLALV